MAELLEEIKGQIKEKWLGYVGHWLNGGSMQGYLVYAEDQSIDVNAFLRQVYEETVSFLGTHSFRMKCRPRYVTKHDLEGVNANGLAQRLAAIAGYPGVNFFDKRERQPELPLFFIEYLDEILSEMDKIAEQKQKQRDGKQYPRTLMDDAGMLFKCANDSRTFNVFCSARDYENSVFVDYDARPYLIYLANKLERAQIEPPMAEVHRRFSDMQMHCVLEEQQLQEKESEGKEL